jgi:hypothetical protein
MTNVTAGVRRRGGADAATTATAIAARRATTIGRPAARWLVSVFAVVLVVPAMVFAQGASRGEPPSPGASGRGVITGGTPPPPFGAGAGAQPLVSPPLPSVPGTVPWDLLGQVRTVRVKDRFLPEFPPSVRQLDKQDVRIVGFMMPLQAGERQSHFLLTVTSQTCAFCVPAGPEGIVEVRTKTPVRVTFDPVLIAGRLEVLRDDPLGVYYRIGNGESLPIPIR